MSRRVSLARLPSAPTLGPRPTCSAVEAGLPAPSWAAAGTALPPEDPTQSHLPCLRVLNFKGRGQSVHATLLTARRAGFSFPRFCGFA